MFSVSPGSLSLSGNCGVLVFPGSVPEHKRDFTFGRNVLPSQGSGSNEGEDLSRQVLEDHSHFQVSTYVGVSQLRAC